MLSAFSTKDGRFHQSAISLDKVTLIQIAVEALALSEESVAEWDWCVWLGPSLGSAPGRGRHGSASSLLEAKKMAIGGAVALLHELTSHSPVFDDLKTSSEISAA
jgi:hypothetical protein